MRKRSEDFITNIIIARMPAIHITNNINPAMDGAALFTERVKLFIQLVFMVGLMPTDSVIEVPVLETGKLFKYPSREKNCGNPIGENGIKGTANNPSSKNHRLYCIRLERLFLNIFLSINKIPTIALINTLHIKKRIIKLPTLIASFFGVLIGDCETKFFRHHIYCEIKSFVKA